MRVGVEDDARRAAAGVGGDLQIVDLGIEAGGVEGDAAELRLHPAFIIPQRFVVVARSAAESLGIGAVRHAAVAERQVEGIVDAAEAEARSEEHTSELQSLMRIP